MMRSSAEKTITLSTAQHASVWTRVCWGGNSTEVSRARQRKGKKRGHCRYIFGSTRLMNGTFWRSWTVEGVGARKWCCEWTVRPSLLEWFNQKHGVLLGAKSAQSELLIGSTSVLLTHPTLSYTEGIYITAMEINPWIKDCFTSKIVITVCY